MHKLIAIAIVLALSLFPAAPGRAAATPLAFRYFGPEGSVSTALELAGFARVDALAGADVIVLNGAVPDPAAVRTSASSNGPLCVGSKKQAWRSCGVGRGGAGLPSASAPARTRGRRPTRRV